MLKMKIISLEILTILLCTNNVISPLTSLAPTTSIPGPMGNMSNKGTTESSSTVNVISQNAVERGGDQTNEFLNRLERRDTINNIRKSIDMMTGRLQEINVKVRNKLNQIQSSGMFFCFGGFRGRVGRGF